MVKVISIGLGIGLGLVLGLGRLGGLGREGILTLQKSILFTPLLPSAGPTGGLGLACPAPTISFTIWSAVARAFDIVGRGCGSFRLGWWLNELFADFENADAEGNFRARLRYGCRKLVQAK